MSRKFREQIGAYLWIGQADRFGHQMRTGNGSENARPRRDCVMGHFRKTVERSEGDMATAKKRWIRNVR